jgi:alpha-methylacyl-CoA racemase
VPGALDGVRVIDLSNLAPGPYASMMLADFGADVVRVEPVTGGGTIPLDPMGRNKRSIRVNLKDARGQQVLHRLVAGADVFLEGFRPGVVDRLGAGYDTLSALNPRLVYCSMTGWGQDGPWAQMAGHDINYIAIAGALAPIGRLGQPPTPPLNLVGDFGGGGLIAAFGIVMALLERERSGAGQYIDAAMVDGAASLNIQTMAVLAAGMPVGRGRGFLDSGAPFYDAYETADGRYIAVGAIEPQFFALFWRLIDGVGEPDARDPAGWPTLKEEIAQRIRQKTRDEWEVIFAGTDACAVPVLELDEVASHPHNVARGTFQQVGTITLPGPAPRLARTPGAVRSGPPTSGADTDAVLGEVGYTSQEIDALRAAGVLGV